MPSLYLASKSPRRREILTTMGVKDFEILPVGKAEVLTYCAGDEEQLPNERPADYVVRTAKEKAEACLAVIKNAGKAPAPVLSADTVVIAGDTILGKPDGRDEAREFMRILSGRTHEVRTAVCLAMPSGLIRSAVSVSKVNFAPLTDEIIEAYIATEEPYDKAGGYGIQGLAGLFIREITGSYSGIMGLPVFETGALLRPLGLTAF